MGCLYCFQCRFLLMISCFDAFITAGLMLTNSEVEGVDVANSDDRSADIELELTTCLRRLTNGHNAMSRSTVNYSDEGVAMVRDILFIQGLFCLTSVIELCMKGSSSMQLRHPSAVFLSSSTVLYCLIVGSRVYSIFNGPELVGYQTLTMPYASAAATPQNKNHSTLNLPPSHPDGTRDMKSSLATTLAVHAVILGLVSLNEEGQCLCDHVSEEGSIGEICMHIGLYLAIFLWLNSNGSLNHLKFLNISTFPNTPQLTSSRATPVWDVSIQFDLIWYLKRIATFAITHLTSPQSHWRKLVNALACLMKETTSQTPTRPDQTHTADARFPRKAYFQNGTLCCEMERQKMTRTECKNMGLEGEKRGDDLKGPWYTCVAWAYWRPFHNHRRFG
ncbi:uncharacterized protein BDR25DRAFT_348095 [Lindgomyces ingoldianus]|uniref:Uncharacterized protein n=1 Tax=Lindgomyces ingoldianus TaxID=673940 RepID=A0ACB6RGB8_9PLEO|nr:uncharacterized protein BDR25DRAFT_348095 [Lindgomyces ingoldianus]KAF2477775.1 hypothetical protein BDR25DRAFT_348095 [Lindgomyces ingoldianus]